MREVVIFFQGGKGSFASLICLKIASNCFAICRDVVWIGCRSDPTAEVVSEVAASVGEGGMSLCSLI